MSHVLRHRSTLLDPLRSYGLMRQANTLPSPQCVALGHESLQVAAYPCWELAFPDVLSSLFLWVLGPVPRLAPPVHSLVSSRTTSASPQSTQVRRAGTSTMTATSLMATVFGAAVIRSWSGSHTCEASRLLLPRQLCTSHRAARPFTPRKERVVTLHGLWHRYISESSN